ncbi:hypothetical protein ciss_17130, partial [Carboxydothermus islandicus]
ENEDRALALAVARGIIPVVAKTKTGLYAVKGYATRADAAYAITMAGLIQVAQGTNTFTQSVSIGTNHSNLTDDFKTWVASNPDGTSAEFCLTCHGPGKIKDRWNSIKNIVYTTHYLNRTFAKNGDSLYKMAYGFALKYGLDGLFLSNPAALNNTPIEGIKELGFGPGQLQFGMYNRLCGAPEAFGFMSFLGRWGIGTQTNDPNDPATTRSSGCGRCHIVYGKKANPKDPNFNTGLFNNISSEDELLEYVKDVDCLLCHADQYYVKKGAAREVYWDGNQKYIYTVGQVYNGMERENFDTLEEAQNAVLTAVASVYKKPTAKGCAVCHDFPADGPAYKRGFWHRLDVHLKDGKLSCIDCHPGGAWTPAIGDTTGQGIENKHQFVIGPMPDLYTPEDGKQAKQCTECHTGNVHANQVLNDHTRRIDCRTCHISKDYGLNLRDFSKTKKASNDGVYEPVDYVFNNWEDKELYNNDSWTYLGKPGVPYLNFKMQGYEHMMRFGVRPIGDLFDEGKSTLFGPMGRFNYPQNPNAKIQPFHRVNIVIPIAMTDVYFKAIGKTFQNFPFMLPFDKAYYANTGDINRAVYQGIYKMKEKDTNGNYKNFADMPYDVTQTVYITGYGNRPRMDGYTAQAIFGGMINEDILTTKKVNMMGQQQNAMAGYFPFYGLMQMDHTILPASEAYTCVDCHSSSGKVAVDTKKWRRLGYSANRSKLLIFTQK